MANLPTNRTTANTPTEHVDDHNTLHAFHNLIDAKGDLIVGTAADTAGKKAVGTDGHVLTADSTQAGGIKWAAPSGTTGVLKDFGVVNRTAGSLTLNSTSWADTGLADLTLTAATGDYIEVGLTALLGGTVNAFLDVVSIVSAAPVNYWSGNNGGASSQGILAWRHEANITMGHGGSIMRALAAGDISGGNVTLRLRYRTASATNVTLYATTDIPLQFWAKNIGPAL